MWGSRETNAFDPRGHRDHHHVVNHRSHLQLRSLGTVLLQFGNTTLSSIMATVTPAQPPEPPASTDGAAAAPAAAQAAATPAAPASTSSLTPATAKAKFDRVIAEAQTLYNARAEETEPYKHKYESRKLLVRCVTCLHADSSSLAFVHTCSLYAAFVVHTATTSKHCEMSWHHTPRHLGMTTMPR